MNGMPPYTVPTNPVSQPPVTPKRQFPPVLLGILYMVGHYVFMSAVSVATLVFFVVIVLVRDGFLQMPSITEDALNQVMEKATDMLYANSDILSLITQILSVVAVVTVFLIIRHKKKDNKPLATAYFSLKKVSPMVLVMSALLAFCAYFTVNAFVIGVNSIFALEPDETEITFSAVKLFTLVIGAPVCEELIYRNMALTNMNKRLSPIVSIVISSAIFGVVHGSPVQMIYAGALGFVFGVLFVRTESIFPSLLAHAVFNALGFGMPFLAEYVETNTASESLFNVIFVVLSVVTNLVAPFILWWILRHTNRPLRVKRIRAKRGSVSAQAPYFPQNPPCGPQGYYGQPPYVPPYDQAYPQRWVFDQRYGWIYVGYPTQQSGFTGTDQNSNTGSESEQTTAIPSDESAETKE